MLQPVVATTTHRENITMSPCMQVLQGNGNLKVTAVVIGLRHHSVIERPLLICWVLS